MAIGILIIVRNSDEDSNNVIFSAKVTSQGTTYGTTNYDAVTQQASYRGIRFGKAPIGNLRFAPPVKYDYGDVTVDASDFGEKCIQSPGGSGGPAGIMGDEDCLFLNVFVPPSIDPAVAPVDLPVAVWIYGGGYIFGSSNDYPADELSKYWSDQGSKAGIVVTMNYRLNAFGFLASEAMRVRDPVDGSTGNAGIQDQRMALQWIQDNIGNFGGNPADVMLFGESAGSASIVNHMTMKKSFGLYSHVALSSGSFAMFSTMPLHYASSLYNQVVANTPCKDQANAIQCLSDLPAYDLYTASWQIQTTIPFYNGGFGPVVDGVEIKTHPYKILEDRQLNPVSGFNAEWDLNTGVDVLHGFNQDEGFSFFPVGPEVVGDSRYFSFVWLRFFPFTPAELTSLASFYLSSAARVLYPATSPLGLNDFWLGGSRGVGDLTFSCTASRTSKTLAPILAANPAANGGPKKIYQYFFEYASVANNGIVPHASGLPFLFRDASLPAKDMVMADVFSTIWGNFLTTRDPNSGVAPLQGAAVWTSYDAATENTFRIRDAAASALAASPSGLRMDNNLKQAECVFWDLKLARLIELDFGAGTDNGKIALPRRPV